MAEAFVNVTEGSGKKVWAFDWSVGANTVLEEVNAVGPQPWASYSAVGGTVSIATANDHILCLNAGASLKVRIVAIHIEQSSNATTAGLGSFSVYRTTTAAPTGGTAVTPGPFDTGDAASGATARTLPTAKGTETTELFRIHMTLRQAISGTGSPADDAAWDWYAKPFSKPLIIPTGSTNGIVIKNNTAQAGAAVDAWIEFVETAF